MSRIEVGDIVSLAYDSTARGVVTDIQSGPYGADVYSVNWTAGQHVLSGRSGGWNLSLVLIEKGAGETPSTMESRREEILKGATRAVMKERNATYGPPTQDFVNIAEILTAMGFRRVDSNEEIHDIKSWNVSELMIALKLARLEWSPDHMDNWLDIAGYAACGWECVKEAEDK